MPENQWQREVDLLRAELHRNVDRLDANVQRCVTESFYLQAQQQAGQRFESVAADITEIKNQRDQEALERQRDRNQMRGIIIAAGVTIFATFASEIVRVIGH